MQWVVTVTLFFAELWAQLLWHNKKVILPAGFFTPCCHGWFVWSGQCWCQDRLTAGDCEKRCWHGVDCWWYPRWSCFSVMYQKSFFFYTMMSCLSVTVKSLVQLLHVSSCSFPMTFSNGLKTVRRCNWASFGAVITEVMCFTERCWLYLT